jgi:hypothetical protein
MSLVERSGSARIAAVVGLATLAGCVVERPNTQVMVTVDAEPGVRSMSERLIVRVWGAAAGETSIPLEGVDEFPFAVGRDGWPRTIALAPDQRDASRRYRVEASAYDIANPSPTDVPLATVRAISGYAEGQTLWLRIVLLDDCIGVIDCEDPDRSCSDEGQCVDARRPVAALPVFPDDAGTAPRPDGSVPPADGAVGTCVPIDCDDGFDCTDDRCTTSGCEHTPHDERCNDDEICTTNRCVVAIGCMFPPSSEPCDDGVYCNGADTCSGGTCAIHGGDPCTTPTVCDETLNACVGCSAREHCPADRLTEWSSCGYADECATSGSQSRSTTTYSCVGAICEPTVVPQMQACGTRVTEGMSCGGSSCAPSGPCGGFASACDEDGVQPFSCRDRVCSIGACGDSPPRTDPPRACSRDTDTVPCDDGVPCTAGTTCTAGACGGGTLICMDGGGGAPCLSSPSLCDDAVPCTFDECNPRSAGADPNGCTHITTCMDAGSGAPCESEPSLCADTEPCTTDACAPGPGADFYGCTHSYSCMPDGGSCDDSYSCTTDTGSPPACSYTPSHSSCDDFDPCTLDRCDPTDFRRDPSTGCVYTPSCDGGLDGGSGRDGGVPLPK